MRLHARVDLVLDQAVHRRSGAGDEGDAEGPGEEQLQAPPARRRQEHADDRGEDDERDHARLGKREGTKACLEALCEAPREETCVFTETVKRGGNGEG